MEDKLTCTGTEAENDLEKQLKELELKVKQKRDEINKRKTEKESLHLTASEDTKNNLEEPEDFPILNWEKVIIPIPESVKINCIGDPGGDGDDPEDERLRAALEKALKDWRPSGDQLVKLLREAAVQLDTNQKKTNITGLIGGVISLVGVPLTVVPLTTPVGVAVSLGGAAIGLGASGVNFLAKSAIEKFVNKMIDDQQSGYNHFREATEDYVKYMQENLIDDEYFEQFEHKWSNEMKNAKEDVGDVKTEAIRNVGKAASAIQNADRLSRVAPLIKYLGMSNRAIRGAMVKDAIQAANLAKKATGIGGAAGKAYRADKIRQATGAFKVARDGAKVGARGVGMAAFGAVFALIDISLNVKDLASGSIAAQSKVYREIADETENMIKSVLELIELKSD